MNYTVSVNGCDAVVEVIDYTPPVRGKFSGPPEDCYPDEEGELVWQADTGNELLNEYIDNDELSYDDICEQLEKQIQEGYEDDRY